MEQLIQVTDGKLLTTSLLVAEKFGKNHFHILRDIENLISQTDEIEEISNLPTLITSSEGTSKFGYTPLFEKTTYQNDQNGQTYPMYFMTRDGFTLLAMGFTGAKALEWKLRYIAAFNAMEEKLREQHDQRLELARLIVNASDRQKVHAIKSLYPEYFQTDALPGSLEHTSDLNTSYRRWIEDYGITLEWIGDFPTSDVYLNYVRYCTENHFAPMGKKTFYRTLSDDFNVKAKQRSNGFRYFALC